MNAGNFTVIWRSGGTARFTWHDTFACTSLVADARAAEVRTMGYKAIVCTTAERERRGLPATWDAAEYFPRAADYAAD